MTSNHHAPYDLGYTRATMDGTTGSKAVTPSESHKTILSSDCRLQFACMKQESLVIADQHAAVNTFPGLVHTASHTTRVGNTRSRSVNALCACYTPKAGIMLEVKLYKSSGSTRNCRLYVSVSYTT